MKYIYAISQHNETTKKHDYQSINFFETEELAINYLRKWRDEIEHGFWDTCGKCTFLEWHDSDEEEVTWMRYSRKSYDSSEYVICLCVEELPIITEM